MRVERSTLLHSSDKICQMDEIFGPFLRILNDNTSKTNGSGKVASRLYVNSLVSIGLKLHHVHPDATNLLLLLSPGDFIVSYPSFLCNNNNRLK